MTPPLPDFHAPEAAAGSYVVTRFGDRDWRTLHDLLVFQGRAERLVQRGKRAYESDEMLRYAAEAICIGIGEAAGRLSDALVAAHPEISFQYMRRQRNFAAHRYDSIDADIVWNTLAVSFPADATKIARLLQRAQG